MRRFSWHKNRRRNGNRVIIEYGRDSKPTGCTCTQFGSCPFFRVLFSCPGLMLTAFETWFLREFSECPDARSGSEAAVPRNQSPSKYSLAYFESISRTASISARRAFGAESLADGGFKSNIDSIVTANFTTSAT